MPIQMASKSIVLYRMIVNLVVLVYIFYNINRLFYKTQTLTSETIVLDLKY